MFKYASEDAPIDSSSLQPSSGSKRHRVTNDSDGDGVIDGEEVSLYGTLPDVADSDTDGLDDGVELAYWGSAWSEDIDADGFINLLDMDSDNDGADDGEEVNDGTDPADPESRPSLCAGGS